MFIGSYLILYKYNIPLIESSFMLMSDPHFQPIFRDIVVSLVKLNAACDIKKNNNLFLRKGIEVTTLVFRVRHCATAPRQSHFLKYFNF